MYVIIGPNTKDIRASVAAALAPFDEALPVDPYKYYLAHSGIRAMAQYYKLPETELEQLATKMRDWMRCTGGVDHLGLFAIRTDNHQAKWDWYEIGGRWDGFIRGRAPSRSNIPKDNSIVASRLLAARDFEKRLPFGIVTPTGEWIESSATVASFSGWYTRKTSANDWSAHVRRILADYPMHRVVCVDTHC